MALTIDGVLEAALALPADDQRVLVEALLAASDTEDSLPFDRSWLPEVRRRLAAHDAGLDRTYTWTEVKERARRKIGIQTTTSLVALLALLSGCGPGPAESALPSNSERQAKLAEKSHSKPFLGFPEDKARKSEEENPETALPGIVTMTAVQPSDYATYQQLKEDGQVVKEETREKVVLFAVEKSLHVPIRDGYGAYLVVTERYRAPIPDER